MHKRLMLLGFTANFAWLRILHACASRSSRIREQRLDRSLACPQWIRPQLVASALLRDGGAHATR
eukprot:377093-Pleurochrysis_carterae.AAC.2